MFSVYFTLTATDLGKIVEWLPWLKLLSGIFLIAAKTRKT